MCMDGRTHTTAAHKEGIMHARQHGQTRIIRQTDGWVAQTWDAREDCWRTSDPFRTRRDAREDVATTRAWWAAFHADLRQAGRS